MNPLLIPELRELIVDKNEQALRDFLERLHPAQAADLIAGLKPEELSWILDVLHDDKEALIFEYIPENIQYDLAIGAGRPQLAKLVSVLAPDDRAEFVRRLPQKIVDEILPLMAQAERNDIKRLLSFAENTAGSRMTTEYAKVSVGLTCREALDKVRHEAPDQETIYTIYVVDTDRHLEGVVGLKDLLLGRPDTMLAKVMRTEVMTVRADEDAAKAAEIIAKYDLLALPVVDDLGRLLGIVTVDDVIDVMEREATQDILSLGGVEPGALDIPYFENPLHQVVRKRLGWLLLLFVAEMFTGTVLRHYNAELAKVVALSFFIPLLIGTGGNAGSQTVSTIIRSLALKEIDPSQWPRILMREASTGFALGLILGIIGFGRSLLWMWGNPDYEMAVAVSVTIVAICTWANMVAAMIPLFAQRAGMDPTVLSAPLITTLVDATGLLIYFTIAAFFLTALSKPVTPVPEAIREQLNAVLGSADSELKEQLMQQPLGQIVGSQAAQRTSAHDWLLPVLALCVLGGVLFSLSRRKPSPP